MSKIAPYINENGKSKRRNCFIYKKEVKVTKVINISLNTDFNCTAMQLLVTLPPYHTTKTI